MRSETIHQNDLSSIEWSDNYFKYCAFSDLIMEGGEISSDFVSCTFERLDFYWSLFTNANFIGCQFIDCVFRGSAFADTRFVDCRLVECLFTKDNLNADCRFSACVAFGCAIEGGKGFGATLRD